MSPAHIEDEGEDLLETGGEAAALHGKGTNGADGAAARASDSAAKAEDDAKARQPVSMFSSAFIRCARRAACEPAGYLTTTRSFSLQHLTTRDPHPTTMTLRDGRQSCQI